jgi:hypothetical protein
MTDTWPSYLSSLPSRFPFKWNKIYIYIYIIKEKYSRHDNSIIHHSIGDRWYTDLQTSCNRVVFKPIARCVRTDYSQFLWQTWTSCYHLVTRLMTVTDLLQVVPTRLFVTSCYKLVITNLVTCYVQTISDLLEQLVASLLTSSTLLQDDNNLFQTCYKMIKTCSKLVTRW